MKIPASLSVGFPGRHCLKSLDQDNSAISVKENKMGRENQE